MLTNILASMVVSLATNATETFPQHMVPDLLPGINGMADAVYRGHSVPDDQPREKWVTTNIVEVTTVIFSIGGRYFEAKSERTITNWTAHFILADPEPPKWNRDTNDIPIPSSWFNR